MINPFFRVGLCKADITKICKDEGYIAADKPLVT